jgi:hypothetical protein
VFVLLRQKTLVPWVAFFLGKLLGKQLDSSGKKKAISFPFAFTGLFSVGVYVGVEEGGDLPSIARHPKSLIALLIKRFHLGNNFLNGSIPKGPFPVA